MRTTAQHRIWKELILAATIFTATTGTTLAQQAASSQHGSPSPVTQTEQPTKEDQIQNIQPQVDSQTGEQVSSKHAEVREDALAALQRAQHALRALEKGNPDEALTSLEQAIGKLQVVLSISPDLALVPIAINITERDLLADPDAIRQAIKDVRELLDKGRVQDARHMLSMLGSEMVIQETSLPLATFPDALAAIAPMITDGRLDTARTELARALNTMVVTDHIIPLPLLRADILLAAADELATISSRTEEQTQQLDALLQSVDTQLEMAELLGYGSKDDYETFRKEMKTIRERIRNNGSGTGIVDRMRQKISKLREHIFN